MLYMKVSSCYYLYVITILLSFQPYGFYATEKYLFLKLLGQVGFLGLLNPIVLIGLSLI